MERTYQSAGELAARTDGPLAKHLGLYVESLIEQQYKASVVYVKALHAVSFDRWLAKHCVVLADLGERCIEGFQRRKRRVHRRICPETRRREGFDVAHLLRFLRSCNLCQPAHVCRTAAAEMAIAFSEHLQIRQGLSSATIERYETVARQFLRERFDSGKVDLRKLCAADVIAFVQRQIKHLQPPGLKCVANALRSFLRYAQYRGEVAPGLVAAVPAVASWATTPSLPKAISPEHAKRAIESCDLDTCVGLRDRAVLLLLARLGLRAGEIIALRLEDCDWDSGHLRVRGKSGRECLLPMPVDVGEAIASYLKHGRPLSTDRHVFLRSMAPIRGLMQGSDGVGSIVRYALGRAGVNAPHRGSHQFRHALAVRMLRGGASLSEIAELLRHRDPQTTSIYAQVDIDSLRPLALPWPGGAR